MDSVTELLAWQHMRRKKPDLSKPQPSLPEYYGTAESDLSDYCNMVQTLHPEVDDPIRVETDDNSLVLAGHGRQHGRQRILEKVRRPTATLTRLKATLPAGSPPIPPRRQPRPSTHGDVRFCYIHPLSVIHSCMAKLTTFIILEIAA